MILPIINELAEFFSFSRYKSNIIKPIKGLKYN